MKINEAAYKELLTLELDKKFTNRSLDILGWKFDSRYPGRIQTFQIATLITNYTSNRSFSHLLYRIWNAFKAIFGRSDWQIASKWIDRKVNKPYPNKTIDHEKILRHALALNQKTGTVMELKPPAPLMTT